MYTRLVSFDFGGAKLPVEYQESTHVKDGVNCDVYAFMGDTSRDLGIVSVAAGISTPRQKVLLGEVTIEGFMAGKGVLTVQDSDTHRIRHRLSDKSLTREFPVKVGDIMQWRAAENSSLEFYEICEPPYEDGRFENLPDQLVA